MFKPETNVLKSMLKSYNQTEESFKKDVESLKTWMKTQPHLPEILDSSKLENFLLLNKCSIERAKEKIDNYYTVRILIPEVFRQVGDEDIALELEIVSLVMLPHLTKDLCRAFLVKTCDKKRLKESSPLSQLAYGAMLQEVRLEEDLMFRDIFIFDMDGIGWDFLRKVTPSIMMKVLTIYEKIFSMRLHSGHVINANPIIQKMLAVVKTLVKPKIFERIHVHEDSKILQELFPLDVVPRDYGGTGKSCKELQQCQMLKVEEYKTRFEELAKMKVNEDLRPGKLKNDEVLGFYGNFKKLDID